MAKPSEFELKLLRPLWRAPRLSARELHDATSGQTKWSYSATRKTLERMEEKGLVRVEQVHGVKTYAAAQSKVETLAGLIRDFARNVLDAEAPMPVAAFSHSKLLDKDEIRELEAMLETPEPRARKRK